MDSGSPAHSQLCTTLNVKRFMENFLDEQKGQGPYVDALSSKQPYCPILPSKLDCVVLSSNPRSPHDPDYNPQETITENLYHHVIPGRLNEQGQTQFEWKPTGQNDLVSSIEKAKLQDLKYQEKRDQVLSKLLSLMSPESKTLLNNLHGFNDAKSRNDLWTIFTDYLPRSHNQVSTSAVQKRTREFLASIQDTEFPNFLENFFREADTFSSDWSSIEHPGYIRIEALLCNTFIQAVRQGKDSVLLKPALESLSGSGVTHLDATLQTARDTLLSYYIRNKAADNSEALASFKASALSPGLREQLPSSTCTCCKAQPYVSLDILSSLFAASPQFFNPKSYCDRAGVPMFCRQCITAPPPCACGQSRDKPKGFVRNATVSSVKRSVKRRLPPARAIRRPA